MVPYIPNDFYVAHAKAIYDEINHDKKKILIYPVNEPGTMHCQQDSLLNAAEDISDWLETIFVPSITLSD